MSGEIYIIFGSLNWTADNIDLGNLGASGLTLRGGTRREYAGYSVAGAGGELCHILSFPFDCVDSARCSGGNKRSRAHRWSVYTSALRCKRLDQKAMLSAIRNPGWGKCVYC